MAEAATGARLRGRLRARLGATGRPAVVAGVVGILVVLVAGGFGVFGVFGAAPPAAASAFLVAATPSNGSALTTAPQEVLLTFSDPVEVVGDGVAVVGPDGGRVDPGTVRRPRPEVVSVPLPGVVAVTRQGTYTVAWHVVTADSRPVRGAVSFSIGTAAGGTAARAAATGAAPVVAGGYGLAAFAALAGLTMLAGGAALGGYGRAAPADDAPGPRRLVMAGWTVLVLATLALLVLRGPDAAGAGLSRAADGDLLGQTLHSHYGRALAARLVLLGAVPVLLARGIGPAPGSRPPRRPRSAAAGLVVAAALALTWAAVGAAATAGVLALAAGVVQLAATVTLLGVPVAVFVALRAAHRPRPEPLGRLTVVSAALIIIAGGYLERHALAGAADPLSTAYGRLLAVKIVALCAVLGIAVRLCGGLRGPAEPGRGTRRLATAGAGLAVIVLALTTVLAEVRPAAEEQASRAATRSARFNVGAGAGEGALSVRLPRTLRGVDAAGLTVLAGGRPLDLPGLRGAWTQPAMGVGPFPVRFTRVGTGRYRLDWPPLPVSGRWRLRLTAGSDAAVEITWPIV